MKVIYTTNVFIFINKLLLLICKYIQRSMQPINVHLYKLSQSEYHPDGEIKHCQCPRGPLLLCPLPTHPPSLASLLASNTIDDFTGFWSLCQCTNSIYILLSPTSIYIQCRTSVCSIYFLPFNIMGVRSICLLHGALVYSFVLRHPLLYG